MIATRGLGRSGSPSSLVTWGMGLGVLVERPEKDRLATIDTLDADLGLITFEQALGLTTGTPEHLVDLSWPPSLEIPVQPIVTDLFVTDVALSLLIEPPALTLASQEEIDLAMTITPIQTSIETVEEFLQEIQVETADFALSLTEQHLSLASGAPDLSITSITDDLEVLDADQLLALDSADLELLLSTTTLKGPA